MSDVQCLWQAGATLGEGPLWSPREAALYWVDIKAPALHRYRPEDGDKTSWIMPEPIGWVIERANGEGLVAGFKDRGFAFLTPGTMMPEVIGQPEPDYPDNRFNDAKADAEGRIWAGTMDCNEREAHGSLYRLDPDLDWHRVDKGYVVTNGPAFSPDGATLYHTDTFEGTIYAFDVSKGGKLKNKRVFMTIPEGDGYPDGMTCDAEGCLWVAHWGGWRITRFTPSGQVDRVIEMPVSQVTSVAFGGTGLDRLFVTSASIGLSEKELEEQPLAGGLFELDPGVTGLPAGQFGG
ncbi:SMP-30/gluconolactonase/LRE family protein [Pelagibius marinus]|uniref:SMP-30/gluconolactonase/LRE family protein n=1 Tax=Pelagibius marinus TaxID=2762760 RepID=UPI0018729332|nr:SMP-30/gluconolactonase/LRE family protein [Pelagibius marinus]